MTSNVSEKRGTITDVMATVKGTENDYSVRKVEKITDGSTSGRRVQKSKAIEHTEGSQKKQTRAKTRVAVSDDAAHSQSAMNKAREKVRAVIDLSKEDGTLLKKEVDNAALPKKDTEFVGPPKKDMVGTVVPKKEVGTGSVKRDVVGSGQPRKDGDGSGSPKKEILASATSKREFEVTVVKNRKLKVKVSSIVVVRKKRDDMLNPSKPEEKSEVTTTEKSKSKDDKLKADRKESGPSNRSDEKNREIMNSDVTSSVDEKPPPRSVRNHSPAVAVAGMTKENAWEPGDLAWGRVGQHPFWPCIIARDCLTGLFSKSKRVGRGLNAVQQSLHVQFFGDNGRHSWIPTGCVIRYEGHDHFQTFAEKVLTEMKKKDKRYSSAFIVKPAVKLKWELAIREAEESVPKAREDRIQFFQDLLPKKKRTEMAHDVQKIATAGTKSSVQLVKKRNKRPNTIADEKPSKQMKIDRQVTLKAEEAKKIENSVQSTMTKKKRGRNKIVKKQNAISGK